ncbi:MAG: alanine racemase [Anaerolineae bacterium]|nr:alanine racemase [Anaerolineae bacterium]
MIYLDDLRNATGGQLFGDASADRFTSFCRDVNLVKPGSLYIALRTETGDGHRLIEQAVKAGAAGVLCQEPPTCDVSRVTVVLVGDTTVALGQWAAYVLRQYGTTVIGVAGLLGKSRACEAISAVLSTRYSVYQSRHNLSGQYDLLLNLGDLTEEHQVAVLELKGRYPGETSRLLTIIRPQLAVITSTNPAGQLQGWRRSDDARWEAQQVLEALPENGTAVLNADDEQVLELRRFSRGDRLTYGQRVGERITTADLLAYNIAHYLDRTAFDLRYDKQVLRNCHLPVLARTGLSASLAALSVGLLFDIPLEDGLRALSDLSSLPGRLRLLEGVRGSFLVDDTAGTTPVAIMAALEWLAGVDTGGRGKIIVLGSPDERDEETMHAYMEIGLKVSQSIDFLVACGEMACVAGRAAQRAGMSSAQMTLLYDTSKVADVVLGYLASPGDLVLVTGGQRVQMEPVAQRLLKNPAAGEWGTIPNKRALGPVRRDPEWSSWIELDLEAVAHNIQQFRQRLRSGLETMAVVEANAYGHGVAQVATAALSSGVTMLGVSSLGEGVELRRWGIEAPILILGHVLPQGMWQAITHDLTVSLYDAEEMHALAQAARGLGRVAKVHLCIDTDTEEMGIPWERAASLTRELVRLEVLEIDGLYASFSRLENGGQERYGREQLARFTAVYNSLHASGLRIPRVHADSIIAVTMPEDYLTMARVGHVLLGIDPLAGSSYSMSLHPVLSWKTRVTQIKVLSNKEQIATISVGYADGLRAVPDSPIKVLLKGQRASVVGRPGANRSMIYVSNLTDAQVGDEVVLIGWQGRDEIGVSEVAHHLGVTILEAFCAISDCVPRMVM